MGIDFANNLSMPDFSQLTEAVRKHQEMMRPILESVQQIKQILQPIATYVDEHRAQIANFVESFANLSKVMIAIEKMGDAQYVCWDNMDKHFVDALVGAANTDEALLSALVADGYKSVNCTISKTEKHPLMNKYHRLFSQSVNAYNAESYDLAVNGFTSILDGLLSDASGNTTHRSDKRIKSILDKLNQHELLDREECVTFTLAATFQPTIESFFQSASFEGAEPLGLNRHWIAHGRCVRKKAQLDAIKMLNLIYGLLLISDLDSDQSQRAA